MYFMDMDLGPVISEEEKKNYKVYHDVESARKMLPGIPAYHFDIGKDYVTLKNAHYLLLSNSSFACFPVFTSKTLKYVLAPKYWARFNVSDGYWASEQNIYDGWHYQDKRGRIFTAEECRQELEQYKKTSAKYRKMNQRPEGLALKFEILKSEVYKKICYGIKIFWAVRRRVLKLMKLEITKV